jgi:hypothetical protein
MPTISQRQNKLKGTTFQAKVRKAGRSLSKTFDSKEAAEYWASRIEDGLTRYRSNVSNNHRMTELAPLLGFVPARVLNALSKVPYTLTDILESSLDAATMVGVYFLINKDEVVYVGQSKTNILDRIAKHKRNGRAFERYAYIQCALGDVDNLERMYIEAFFPVGNISTSNSTIEV